jgi:hypothetical protein
MDALAGAVTSGQYLRGNGTDVVMSAIQAADVPTLNQNTTGTAAVSTAATVTTSSTASAFKVPFANTTANTTGNYGLLQDSEGTFTYNPSTNTLTVGNAVIGKSEYYPGSIELNRLDTGDRSTLIDFHSSGLPGTIDYSARIIRGGGVNGNWEFQNTGTGSVIFTPGGSNPALYVTAGAGMQYNGALKLGGGGGAPEGQLDFNAESNVRWLARGGRLDCVNTGNTAWQQGVFRGLNLRFRNASDVTKFTVGEGDGARCTFDNGGASRGASGYPITTPDDSIANAIRSSGYIEYQSNAGAIGVNYFNSDERLKKNIAPTQTTAREAIDAISFKQFDWNEYTDQDGVHVGLGVIAQQLQQINPKFVNVMSDSTLGVNEPELMTYALKAIQELSAELAAVKQELAQMKGVA